MGYVRDSSNDTVVLTSLSCSPDCVLTRVRTYTQQRAHRLYVVLPPVTDDVNAKWGVVCVCAGAREGKLIKKKPGEPENIVREQRIIFLVD